MKAEVYGGTNWHRWGLQFFVELYNLWDGLDVCFGVGPFYWGFQIWRER